jgi:hypothetical protein
MPSPTPQHDLPRVPRLLTIQKFNRTAVGATKRGPTPVLKMSGIRKVRGQHRGTSSGRPALAADLRDPAAVLADPGLRALIDSAKPTRIIRGAVLHFLDADAARAVTAGYARQMAPGSFMAISVACYDDEALDKRLSAEYTAATWHNHSRADVESFLAGLELVGPGVTEAGTWRPWMPEPVLRRRDGHVLAGVGRVIVADVRGRRP